MLKDLIKKKYFRISATILALVLVINFAILPFVIGYQTYSILKEHNLRSVGVNKLYCNILAGSCKASNIAIFRTPEEKITIRKLNVDVDVLKLLFMKINIANLKIDGAFAHIKTTTEKKLFISGIDPDSFKTEENSAEQQDEESSNSSGLALGLDQLTIQNSRILLSDEVKKSAIELSIRNVEIKDFTPWQDDALTSLTTDLSFNNIDLISNITAELNKEQKSIDGSFDVKNINKTGLSRLLGKDNFTQSFGDKGVITIANLGQKFSLKIDQNEQNLAVSGDISSNLQNLNLSLPSPAEDGYINITNEQISLEAKGINYKESEGKQSYSLNKMSVLNPFNILISDDIKGQKILIDLNFKELSIGEANSDNKENKTPIKLVASINKSSDITADGWIKPFTNKISMNSNIKLDNFDLSNYSPYLESFIGTKLKKGKVNLAGSANIDAGNIDSQIDLNIQSLSLKSSNDSEALTKQLGIPLQTAVGLLQDSDGNIELKIPVKGNSSQPDFDVGQVVSTAIKGALISTISLALDILFPPSMLISYAISESKYPSLKPLEFERGEAEISKKTSKEIEVMTTLLDKRPKLNIGLCAVSTAKDLDRLIDKEGLDKEDIYPFFTKNSDDDLKLKEKERYVWQKTYEELESISKNLKAELEALSKKRADAVKALITKKDSEFKNRISDCLPEFEIDNSGNPFVEISW